MILMMTEKEEKIKKRKKNTTEGIPETDPHPPLKKIKKIEILKVFKDLSPYKEPKKTSKHPPNHTKKIPQPKS